MPKSVFTGRPRREADLCTRYRQVKEFGVGLVRAAGVSSGLLRKDEAAAAERLSCLEGVTPGRLLRNCLAALQKNRTPAVHLQRLITRSATSAHLIVRRA